MDWIYETKRAIAAIYSSRICSFLIVFLIAHQLFIDNHCTIVFKTIASRLYLSHQGFRWRLLLGELAVGVEHEPGDLCDVVDLERPAAVLGEDLLDLGPHLLDEEGDGGQDEHADEDAQLEMKIIIMSYKWFSDFHPDGKYIWKEEAELYATQLQGDHSV